MGNVKCTALDQEDSPPCPTYRGSEVFMTQSEVQIAFGVDYTPSESPYILDSRSVSVQNRLPRKENPLKEFKPEFDSSLESLENELIQKSLAEFEPRTLPKTRSISERADKRSPDASVEKLLSNPSPIKRQSVPRCIHQFREKYLRELVLKKAIEKKMERECSDIFLSLDTSRSRAQWMSPVAIDIVPSPAGSVDEFTWAVAKLPPQRPRSSRISRSSKRRSQGSIPYRTVSDSQFKFATPVLTPIFSNKVTHFAEQDSRTIEEIVEQLSRELSFSQGQSLSSTLKSRCTSPSGSETPRFESRKQRSKHLPRSGSNLSVDSASSRRSSRNFGGAQLLSPSIGGMRIPSESPTREAPVWNRIRNATKDLKNIAGGCDSTELEEFAKELELLKQKYQARQKQTILVS